jgi:hypothetical protein
MSTGLETLRYPPTEQENYDEMPIGFYFPWEKSMQSSLPAWFVECNGQLLDDADSPLNGEYIPNLNGVAKTKSATLDGTTTVTVTTTKDLYAGADVNGTSIPSGAKILSIDSDTEFTLDQSATGSGTETLTIGGNGPVFLAGNSSTGVWKADQFQKFSAEITINKDGTGSSLINDSDQGVSAGSAYWTRPSSTDPNKLYASKFLNDGTHGEPRTGTETYPKHRGITYVMKIKYSGKVKLITGFNVTGEEFGNFSESGANVKPTDRLAVFYPDGSVYKNVYARRLRYSQPKTISTTPYTILEDDPIELLINFSTGIINLPENPQNGQEIQIIKTHATQGAITITPDGAHTIDGASSIDIDSQYDYAKVKWIGGIWTLLEYKDHGSNTNGNWMRYSDGTMTMAGQKAIPSGAEVTITFPKEAQSVPYVTTAIDRDGGYGGLTVMIKGITTTNFAVDVVLNGAPDGGTAEWICSGRWRA